MAIHCRCKPHAGFTSANASAGRCVASLPHPRRRVNLVHAVGQASQETRVQKEIKVDVEETSWSSRKLFARVGINAPVDVVWGCLTDYERLGDIVPSLVENKCIEKRANGALLRQVGAQDLAMGVKFSAVCTLECTEFLNGVPESFLSSSTNGSEGLLPAPMNSLTHVPTRDITFVQVEGDFKAFRGVWRMQPGNSGCTILYYTLFVQPHAWLPVRLIQNRIQSEVMKNLQAIAAHSERLHSTSRLG